MNNPALYASDTDNWWTPPDIIDRVLVTFGGIIDLDPCSNLGIPNVPASLHYTIEDNGLTKAWLGQVYMNPPYGRSLPKWIEKMVRAYRSGEIDSAVALVPARPGTRWIRKLDPFVWCLIWGRLKFSGNNKEAPFPSMAIYLGPDEQRFVDAFSPIGSCKRSIE